VVQILVKQIGHVGGNHLSAHATFSFGQGLAGFLQLEGPGGPPVCIGDHLPPQLRTHLHKKDLIQLRQSQIKA
jgi:hypothetical protein